MYSGSTGKPFFTHSELAIFTIVSASSVGSSSISDLYHSFISACVRPSKPKVRCICCSVSPSAPFITKPSMILADSGERMMFFLSEFLQTRLVRLNVNSFVRYSSCSSAEAKVIGLG